MNKVKKPIRAQSLGRVPLYKALSKMGKASREEAKALILEGNVKVHGTVEKNPERMVNPDRAHIEISGIKATKEIPRLILFHKPVGCLTTKRDPEGRPTIYDFLPAEFQNFHAVGRLDQHTSGLLLMTNHTPYSNFLTNPENQIPRTYIVQVRGISEESHWTKMQAGVMDRGECLKFDSITPIKLSSKESTLKVVLTEGKYREIRRMFGFFGCEVIKLKRISFGPFEIGTLKPGAIQELETKIVESLI
jgi:23S rRNA pseudouridine2605 synthase